MQKRILRIACAAALAAGLAAGRHAAPAEPAGAHSTAVRPHQQERPDDPQAPFSAADDVLARSPAASVTFGPFVSVQVNIDAAGQNIVGDASNEPSIVVNPLNPNNMVIAWRHFASVTSNFRQAGYAYTLDGGTTWTFPGVLTPGTFRSDPVLGADLAGNLFFQSLEGNLNLDVFRSTNGGVSWGAPVPSFGGDKNWMTIDTSGGPASGFVYGIWQRFADCCGTSVFTRSTFQGTSFQIPVPVALWPTFGTMDVGPDGTVFAAGVDGTVDQDFNTFVVSRSANAQVPAATPTFSGVSVNLAGAMAFGGPNPDGLLGQANVVVDRSTGPTKGNVYLLASVAPFDVPDPLDVRFSRSTDGGTTWSSPVRVNDDASLANWQWFGAIAVAPNGRLDVVWNDTRNSGQTNVSQLFYSWSYDGGVTWAANLAASPPFDSTVGFPNQNKIGDYLGIVSDTVQAHVAYAATFNGEEDVYYVRLFPDCNHNGISDETDLASGTSADCDHDHVPDECQTASPDPLCRGGASVSETLGVARDAAGDLHLSWGASCRPEDTDYEVYEGTLGIFPSHAPRLCTTGGSTSATLTPADGDTYYLIVPVHGVLEGSYGRDSRGAEIPPGVSACRPQVVRSCSGP